MVKQKDMDHQMLRLFTQRKRMHFPLSSQDLGKVRKLKQNEEAKMCPARHLGRFLGDLVSTR